MGCVAAEWLALLHHNKKILGSIPGLDEAPFSVGYIQVPVPVSSSTKNVCYSVTRPVAVAEIWLFFFAICCVMTNKGFHLKHINTFMQSVHQLSLIAR